MCNVTVVAAAAAATDDDYDAAAAVAVAAVAEAGWYREHGCDDAGFVDGRTLVSFTKCPLPEACLGASQPSYVAADGASSSRRDDPAADEATGADPAGLEGGGEFYEGALCLACV